MFVVPTPPLGAGDVKHTKLGSVCCLRERKTHGTSPGSRDWWVLEERWSWDIWSQIDYLGLCGNRKRKGLETRKTKNTSTSQQLVIRKGRTDADGWEDFRDGDQVL